MKTAVQSVIRRIRKLMNYAADPSASAGEIENALGHARRLMDQFHLDEASVATAEPEAEIAGVEVMRRCRFDRATKDLSRVPCIVCDVEAASQIRPAADGRPVEHMFFFGFPADVAVARALFEQLLVALRTLARRTVGGDRGDVFRSFAAGFTIHLVQRALRDKHASRQSPQTGAIVVAREKRVREQIREKFPIRDPRPNQMRPVKVGDGDAFMDGYAAARKVSIRTNQLGGPGGGHQQQLFATERGA